MQHEATAEILFEGLQKGEHVMREFCLAQNPRGIEG